MLKQLNRLLASCVVFVSVAGLAGCSGDKVGGSQSMLGGPRVGMERPVPVSYARRSRAAGSEVIVVRAGDTIASLSQRHDVSIADLMVVNGLRDPAIVRGQILVLPAAN